MNNEFEYKGYKLGQEITLYIPDLYKSEVETNGKSPIETKISDTITATITGFDIHQSNWVDRSRPKEVLIDLWLDFDTDHKNGIKLYQKSDNEHASVRWGTGKYNIEIIDKYIKK